MKKKQKTPLSYVSLYQIVPETKPHIFIKMCLPVAVTTWPELQRTKKEVIECGFFLFMYYTLV